MNRTREETLKRLHLIEELRVAVSTIKTGMGLLQQCMTTPSANVFVFMLVLSTGLERYMKVLLCMHSLNASGAFLDEKTLRHELGHNLIRLRDEVLDTCFTSEALARPAVRDDVDYIENDSLLNVILETLSDFAEGDRYIYLDGINNPSHNKAWLDERWENLLNVTISEEQRIRLDMDDRVYEFYSHTTDEIVISLERFLRALARTVTLAGLSDDIKSMGTDVWPFLMKMDKNFGQTDYQIC